MGNKYTNIDLSKYDNGYQESDEVRLAKQKQLTAENAVSNYGDFQYGKQSEYDNAMNAILNRKGFSYDLNGDALYQQYKDNYINQGKQAMIDTMGQAAAMTGGYGNSYAATVGNQTYQGYLQNLNNVIPELYQMALDRYNAEGDRLATNYNLLATDRSEARSDYESKYNKLVADRDYYGNRYDSIYNQDYAVWNDNRTHDTTQYWNEYNAGYQAEQDQIANDLAREQLKLQKDSQKIAELQAGVVRDEKGNIVSVATPSANTVDISAIDPSIITKVEDMENDILRANYLSGLVTAKLIDEPQMKAILAQTKKEDTVEYEGGRYYMVDDGGVNSFLGLGKWSNSMDDNAKVMAEDGNTYTMKQLYDQKIDEGKSETEAKNWVVGLQKKIGAH